MNGPDGIESFDSQDLALTDLYGGVVDACLWLQLAMVAAGMYVS